MEYETVYAHLGILIIQVRNTTRLDNNMPISGKLDLRISHFSKLKKLN